MTTDTYILEIWDSRTQPPGWYRLQTELFTEDEARAVGKHVCETQKPGDEPFLRIRHRTITEEVIDL